MHLQSVVWYEVLGSIAIQGHLLHHTAAATAVAQCQLPVLPAQVLILLPMRNMAHSLVLRLLQLTQKETRADSILGKQRFMEEFGPSEEDSDGEGMTERGKTVKAQMPLEHQRLFEGNCDDHFRIGLKITRGSVRLYSDFYESDIIVASPLALATKLTEADEEEGGPPDMLSSIEVLLVPRLDVMQMQNWAHLTAGKQPFSERKRERPTRCLIIREPWVPEWPQD